MYQYSGQKISIAWSNWTGTVELVEVVSDHVTKTVIKLQSDWLLTAGNQLCMSC